VGIRRNTARPVVVAIVGGLIGTGAFSAPAVAKKACRDVPYSDEAQAAGRNGEPNAAGVRFDPISDTFTVWDNDFDGRPSKVFYNYAGVRDKWKFALQAQDGKANTLRLDFFIKERHRRICFGIFKAGPNSPIVRYTTRP
jgi:hypothetical protein